MEKSTKKFLQPIIDKIANYATSRKIDVQFHFLNYLDGDDWSSLDSNYVNIYVPQKELEKIKSMLNDFTNLIKSLKKEHDLEIVCKSSKSLGTSRSQ